ncbi:hypothetical protein [Marinitoga lauensis]|nr:hypothetical protein [Marinitoga lauensis]
MENYFYYNNPDESVHLKAERGYPKLGATVDSGGLILHYLQKMVKMYL